MIPKKIHYCWIGKAPLPEKDRKCIESWKKFCPDYEIIEWNESNYDFSKCQYMKQAYDAKKWGFVPDYARLDIVYNEGGIYMDTDVELVRSIDDLLELEAFMGFENKSRVALGLGFGAEAKNKIIKQMCEDYKDLRFINADGTLNITASPTYTTRVLEQNGLNKNGKNQMVGNIKIFAPEYFAPLCYSNNKLQITQNTYSIHWFNASWHDSEQKRIKKRMQLINRIFGMRLGKVINKGFNGVYRVKKEGIKWLKK